MRMRPEGQCHSDDAPESLPRAKQKTGSSMTLRHHFRVRAGALTTLCESRQLT